MNALILNPFPELTRTFVVHPELLRVTMMPFPPGCLLPGDLCAAHAGSLGGLLSLGLRPLAGPGAPAVHGQQEEGERQAEAGQDVHRHPDSVRRLLASVSQLLHLHIPQHSELSS